MKGRKPRIDKTEKLVTAVLQRNPDGLTLRELGRQTGIPKSTLSYQLTKHLPGRFDEIIVAPKGKRLLRLIRLKAVKSS